MNCAEVKRHLLGVSSLLPTYGSWGLNSGLQTWLQVTLPAEPVLCSSKRKSVSTGGPP